jgi:hypothetical protein
VIRRRSSTIGGADRLHSRATEPYRNDGRRAPAEPMKSKEHLMTDHHTVRVLIERLARAGASEKEIEQAVRDALREDNVIPLERERRSLFTLLRRAA